MYNKKLRLPYFALLFLFSCTSHELSDYEASLQPSFQKGEKIVFCNQQGDTLNIQIDEIVRKFTPDDHLAIFPNRMESIQVYAESPEGRVMTLWGIVKNKDRSYFKFDLTSNVANYYGKNYWPVDSIIALNRDVFLVKSNDTIFNHRPNAILELEWSLVRGPIGFKVRNGQNWKVISTWHD